MNLEKLESVVSRVFFVGAFLLFAARPGRQDRETNSATSASKRRGQSP